MAEGKNKIIVYRDWITTFEPLTDDEAGKLIKHFFRYINDNNPEPPDRLISLLFEPIKQTLKRDLRKYEKICVRNQQNGALGGRPKETHNNPNKPSGLKNNPNKPDSDSDSDSDINISFDVFWDAYGKKQGDKNSCKKRWDKLTDADRQKIIDTLPAFLLKIKDKQYQPYPATYLNQKRWEDEIDIAPIQRQYTPPVTPDYIDPNWRDRP